MLDSVFAALKKGDNTALLLLLTAALLLFSFALLIVLLVSVRRLNRRIERLTGGAESGSLETTLTAHLETVALAVRRMETLEQAVGILQAQIPLCLQRTGLVRYDAFEDVGGAQSFSLALLDARGDGVILTGVYGRNDARVYSKALTGGRASHTLSKEEEQALREAANS